MDLHLACLTIHVYHALQQENYLRIYGLEPSALTSWQLTEEQLVIISSVLLTI